MRARFFLRKHNIGLHTLQLACRFLNLSIVQVNSQLSDEKIRLLETTLNSDKFEKWVILKKQIEAIEAPDRLSVIVFLNPNSKEIIDTLLAERLLNALSTEISLKRYSEESIEKIQSVMQSKLTLFEKIYELKKIYPFQFTNYRPSTEQEEYNETLELANTDRRRKKYDKRDDLDSEEVIMRAIGNGDGDLFGF